MSRICLLWPPFLLNNLFVFHCIFVALVFVFVFVWYWSFSWDCIELILPPLTSSPQLQSVCIFSCWDLFCICICVLPPLISFPFKQSVCILASLCICIWEIIISREFVMSLFCLLWPPFLNNNLSITCNLFARRPKATQGCDDSGKDDYYVRFDDYLWYK